MTAAPEGLTARARRILRASHKADDFLWARHVTRPVAALFLAALHRVPLTPDRLTLVGLVPGLASAAAFAAWPGSAGLWVGYGLGQLAFTIDCMDGMLARVQGTRTRHGTALDFLVDALKQLVVFPALGLRLWLDAGRPVDLAGGWPLWAALAAGPIVGGALALTTFLRSPEATGGEARTLRRPRAGGAAGALRALLSFLLNYPSWILVPVILDRMEWVLILSLPLYAAHALMSLVILTRRFGGGDGSGARAGAADPGQE